MSDLPDRKDVKIEDTWDLSALYADEAAWEKGFEELQTYTEKVGQFKGTLDQGPKQLLKCFQFNDELGMLEERLGYYAHLRTAEDGGDSEHQGRMGRYMRVASELSAASAYLMPEIQALPDEQLQSYMDAECLQPYRFNLEKIARQKPHVLSEGEERLLAMQTESSQTPRKAFGSLTNVDMSFGEIKVGKKKESLTQSTLITFLENPDRKIRKKAYKQFLDVFDNHKHTLADLYAGSVQQDVYHARVRNHDSARSASLFSDNVPESVYDNLISSVHDALPTLHRYYAIRKKALKLKSLRLYDTKVPLVPELEVKHTYEQAVDVILESLKPLGEEYTTVLREGMTTKRWVDRYENKGKRSGAFSAGSFCGEPYILMNFKEKSFNDVFTLTHEAGHSMHSYYSVKSNPFHQYNYTIFVAEVASTFNEQLLAHHLRETVDDKVFQTYLVNKQIDDIIGTIFRQTMFAEFEKDCHAMVEAGRPMTVDAVRSAYRKLLEQYFGPKVKLEDTSDLEGLRIPHFYSAFYVYKYATGLSAAIALSRKVLAQEEGALERYLHFLTTGGSAWPLDQLREAGVDMTTPEPVGAAMATFGELVDRLENAL